jgi:methylthioribose-1-phosphate isomerase
MNLRGAGLIGCAPPPGASTWPSAGMPPRPISPREIAAEAAAPATPRAPTAKNLEWALVRMRKVLAACAPAEPSETARREAQAITDEDAEFSRRMASTAWPSCAKSPRASPDSRQRPPPCNAGWLAFVDHGNRPRPRLRRVRRRHPPSTVGG